MPRQPEGPPPPPVAARLRIRFAKRGRLRFTSHRDIARALERALRRAGVPMAFSAGFSPHPKISYVGAAATGVASEAEYFEIALAEVLDPQRVAADLDAALPAGLDIVEVVVAAGAPLADRIDASLWRVELPGVSTAAAAAAVAAFLAAPSVPVTRLTKAGVRDVDARAGVVDLRVENAVADTPEAAGSSSEVGWSDHCAILHVVVRHLTPAVRPDDVVAGLRSRSDLAPPVAPVVTRLAQGLLHEDRLADPLAPEPGVPAGADVVGAPSTR